MADPAERRRALRALAQNGWRVSHVNRKGYIHMLCGCGSHRGVLHKTPSNPNHFRQKAAFLIRQCST
jgi:hypothetical protein